MAKKKSYDPTKVRALYDNCRKYAQSERYAYERDWFRNCLFYLGIQWITYVPQGKKWSPRRLAKWVPRPVTNKFAAAANTIMQTISQKEPDTSARPGTDSPDDLAAAQVADKNFDVILREMDSESARNMAAAWLTLTGNVILHTCYDNDPRHGTTFIQHLRCSKCGKDFAPDEAGPSAPISTPAQPSPIATDMMPGGAAMPLPVGAPAELPPEPQQTAAPQMSEMSCPFCQSPDFENAVNGAEPVGEDLPNGKMKLEVFSPFEVFVNLEARSENDIQEILVRRRYPVEVIRERYDDPTIEADNNSNVGGAIGLNLLRAIAYASGNAMYGTGIASGRTVGDDQSVTVDMLWRRPCADFPEGLVAVFANEKLLNEKQVSEGIPYRNNKGEPMWPWRFCVFDPVPGRFFGRTPMDDVAPKQEQRNKLEALIQLIVTRCANPVWLIPKNLGITEVTGEPGEILEGNWTMDPRLKPERVPGENIPTSIIAWLEKIDRDIDELAGTFDVLRGNAPSGVSAGTALRLLLERATTRFTPVLRRFEVCWEKVCNDALCIFQQMATEDRINMIQGPGQTWEVQRFAKADIAGSVDIVVEAGSGVPKSAVGDQALIQDLTAMKVIDPINPETQYKILERFGSTGLLGDTDLNIKAAQRENWRFTNESKPPVMNPVVDNHMVHKIIHTQYALSSDFDEMSDEQKAPFYTHIMEHQMALMPAPMPAATGQGQGEKSGSAAGPEGAGSGIPQSGGNGGPPPGASPLPAQDTAQPPEI